MISLRPYQERFVQDIRGQFFAGSKSVLGVLPTGGGKTVCFSWIGKSASERGQKVLVLVHREELLNQSYSAMSSVGIRTGMIAAGYTPDPKADCQVAMVATMANRVARYKAPNLIVVDECHHANAKTWRTVLQAYPNAYVLGVTATPIRGDGVGLGAEFGGLFDTMVEGPQIQDLIDQGYLVSPRVYAPSKKIDLTGLKVQKSGDWKATDLALRLDKPSITGDSVHYYRKYADGDPCVVFCATVAHAQHVADEFRAAGYRAFAVDGQTDRAERSRILKGLGTGEVQVVTSCDIISEGTDIPAIRCAILLRPTASLGLYLQQVGRALRLAPGKKDAIIIDQVGNTARHGKPDSLRAWSLVGELPADKEKREAEALKLKNCSQCFCVHEATACPSCGHVEVPKRREASPKREDGELVLVEHDPLAIISQEALQKEKDGKLYGALRNQAKRFGRSMAWVDAKFAEIKARDGRKTSTLQAQQVPETSNNNTIYPPHFYEII